MGMSRRPATVAATPVPHRSKNERPAANEREACSIEDCADAVAIAKLANAMDRNIATFFILRRASTGGCGQPFQWQARQAPVRLSDQSLPDRTRRSRQERSVQ